MRHALSGKRVCKLMSLVLYLIVLLTCVLVYVCSTALPLPSEFFVWIRCYMNLPKVCFFLFV